MDTKQDKTDIAKTLDMEQGAGGRKKSRRRMIAASVAVVAVLIAVVFWECTGSPGVVQYVTEDVRRGNLTVVVTATGTLKPINNTVSVGSELSGIIKSVEVDYNSKVKVGQILARLDTSKLEAQVTQSEAALAAAKAKILQTQATIHETQSKLAQYRKVRQLSGNKVPSQAEMDAAEAAYERALADDAAAKAAVSQAQATLDAIKTDLAKAVIRSPISGVVLTRDVEPGQTVAAAYQAPTLFTLAADLTKMELHVNVDEADISQIREGQNATFSVAAYPNRTFDARIVRANYGSTTTSGVVTYETVLMVENKEMLLRPGMTATADIVVKKITNAVLIPGAALRFTPPVQGEKQPSRGLVGSILPRPPRQDNKQVSDNTSKRKQRVWTLVDGKPAPVAVTLGSANGGMTEVLEGDLKPGMAVIVDSVQVGK